MQVPLGYDAPRCIVHCPSWKAFAVACLRIVPAQVGQAEVFSSSVQLFNETSFESAHSPRIRPSSLILLTELAQLTVNNGEEVTALHSCSVTLGGVLVPFICAGITVYDSQEREPSQGRVVLLQTTVAGNSASQALTALAAAEVEGCVYALTSVGDIIVAAVNSSVRVNCICRQSGTGLLNVRLACPFQHGRHGKEGILASSDRLES